MQMNRNYYLDFTADLQRLINALIRNNNKTAQVFFLHAHKIYKTNLKPSINPDIFPLQLQRLWEQLSTRTISEKDFEKKQFADQILTISAIIFRKSLYALN